MDEHEKKKQEIMEELARRFRDSSNNLKNVARRINEAARLHQDNLHSLDRAGQRLRECVGGDNAAVVFTYLEYVEFSNADEFRKFRAMDIITDEEIRNVDWDDLGRHLLSA